MLYKSSLQLIKDTKKSMMLIFKTFASFGLLDFKGFSPFLLREAVSLSPRSVPGWQAVDQNVLLDIGMIQRQGRTCGDWPGTGLGRECIKLVYWRIRPTFPCFQVSFVSEEQHTTTHPQGNGNQESPRAALTLPGPKFSMWFRHQIQDFPLK